MARLVICKYIDWIGLPPPPTPINVTPRLRPTFLLFQTRSLGGKKKKKLTVSSRNSHSARQPNYSEFRFRKTGEKNRGEKY